VFDCCRVRVTKQGKTQGQAGRAKANAKQGQRQRQRQSGKKGLAQIKTHHKETRIKQQQDPEQDNN
jgi:hypothetical protein